VESPPRSRARALAAVREQGSVFVRFVLRQPVLFFPFFFVTNWPLTQSGNQAWYHTRYTAYQCWALAKRVN
jgi:hypothetical protein